MEKINSFTFYRNYYELLNNIPKKDKLLLLEAIVDYVFEDKEPELNGLNEAIWNNIVLPINTSKKQSFNGLKGGAPDGNKNAKKNNPTYNLKTTQKQPKNKPKTNQKQTNNISISFSISISNKIEELFKEYLDIRIKEKYIVNETVIKRLENKLKNKPENIQQQMLENAINGGWKDLYDINESKPEWFDKKVEKQEVDKKTEEELKKILEKY